MIGLTISPRASARSSVTRASVASSMVTEHVAPVTGLGMGGWREAWMKGPWPAARDDGRQELLIRSLAPSALAAPVKRVTLLADRSDIPFTQDAAGLHLRVPKDPVGRHAYVFKIESR